MMRHSETHRVYGMNMQSISSLFVLVVTLTGCGAVMCSFTGNAIGHCPGLKQASANQSQGGGETAPAEETTEKPAEPGNASSTSESSSSSSPTPKPDDGPACKPDGAVTNGGYQCCGGKDKLTPDRTKHVCCSGGADCS